MKLCEIVARSVRWTRDDAAKVQAIARAVLVVAINRHIAESNMIGTIFPADPHAAMQRKAHVDQAWQLMMILSRG